MESIYDAGMLSKGADRGYDITASAVKPKKPKPTKGSPSKGSGSPTKGVVKGAPKYTPDRVEKQTSKNKSMLLYKYTPDARLGESLIFLILRK